MIGTISVRETAKNSNFPLQPIYAFTSAPSHIRLIDVPKQIGTWKITSVSVSVVYPDGTSLISPCTLVGGCWSTTFSGCSTTGKVENGATVLADGVDELGQNVVGYVLGKGDIIVLDGSMEVSPDKPQTVFMRMCLSGDVDDPKLGTMADIDGWKVYTLSGWQSLGMTLSDLSGKADLSDVQTLSAEVSAKADLSDLQLLSSDLSGKADANDIQLTPIQSEWKILRDGVDATSQFEQPIWQNNTWVVPYSSGETLNFGPDVVEGDGADATELEWLTLDANDTEVWYYAMCESVGAIGYTLGSQTDKPLQPQGNYATKQEVEAKQDALTQLQIDTLNGMSQQRATFVRYNDSRTAYINLLGECQPNQIPDNENVVACQFGTAVTAIGGYMFTNNVNLTAVSIPSSVKRIVTYAFDGCQGLSSIVLPTSVEEIWWGAFQNTGLTSLDIPDSVVSVRNYAFGGSKVTDVKIGNGVKGLGGDAFSSCQRLSSLTIGNEVSSIGENAFRSCTALPSVTLPASVNEVGANAFKYCESLSSVVVKGKTQAEAEALLTAAGLPDGCEIKTWNDASQEWFKAELSTAISGLSESSTAADIVAALKSLI